MHQDPAGTAREFQTVFEGLLSVDPVDSGNWTSGVCHQGACVGSCRGITARTYGRYRGIPAAAVTRAMIAAITADEAVKIAVKLFYDDADLGALPWDPVIASLFDFGWGAGPVEAAVLFQRMIGTVADGKAGPGTARAYVVYLSHHGLEATATAWANARDKFYQDLAHARPKDAKYLKGWTRRTAYYRPGGAWWKRATAKAA